MNSDPHERMRRRVRAVKPGGAWTGVLGIGLILTPIGVTLQGLSAAASHAPIGVIVDPGITAVWIVGVLAVLLLCSLFVACETALQDLRKSHTIPADDGQSEITVPPDFVDHRPRYIAACVLGSQTMRAWLVLLCLLPAKALVDQWGTPGHMDPFWALFIITGVISIPVFGLNVITSDLIARSYGALYPQKVAIRYAPMIRVFGVVFAVPSQAAMWAAGLVTNRFGANATFDPGERAEEEIRDLVDSYKESGEIEQEEQKMINSVFEFGDTVAREIMTPRVDVDSVPLDTPVLALAELIESTGHSRFPVYEDNDDQIVGIVHAKDVLATIARGETQKTLAQIQIRTAVFVPENKPLHDLLTEMRIQKAQMVIVQDEHGGTAGIVTVEDLVEEVVGEIVDEYDSEEETITQDGTDHIVDGRLHLDDVNLHTGTDFSSEEFDTLGGYVFGLFGRQPKVGEQIDEDGYRFQIESTDGRRIERVRISRLAQSVPVSTEDLSV